MIRPGRRGLDVNKLQHLMTWVTTPIVVPAARFFIDPPQRRKQLFVRDFSTFVLGSGIYFLTLMSASTLLKKAVPALSPPMKQFIPFLIGMTAYCGFSIFGVRKICQQFDQTYKCTASSLDSLPTSKETTPLMSRTTHRAEAFKLAEIGLHDKPLGSKKPTPISHHAGFLMANPSSRQHGQSIYRYNRLWLLPSSVGYPAHPYAYTFH
ncbi:MAG: hypothetical protein KC474_06440 [Cyanobacteria bacterium HKST-UBA04]|nr:hypothetical protein [Cyanobacteria bacterium HKST-UBA04]